MTAIRRTSLDFFVVGQDGQPQANAIIKVLLSAIATDPATGATVLPEEQTGLTDSEGLLSLMVWPNGDSGTYYTCTLMMPDQPNVRPTRIVERVVVPDITQVDYSTLRGTVPPPPLDAATAAALRAIQAAQEAQDWAESLVDAPEIDEATGLLAFYFVDETGEQRIGALPMRSLASMLERLVPVVRAHTVTSVEGGVLATLPPGFEAMKVRAVTLGRNVTAFLVGTQQTDAGVFCPDLQIEQAQEGIYLTGVLV